MSATVFEDGDQPPERITTDYCGCYDQHATSYCGCYDQHATGYYGCHDPLPYATTPAADRDS